MNEPGLWLNLANTVAIFDPVNINIGQVAPTIFSSNNVVSVPNLTSSNLVTSNDVLHGGGNVALDLGRRVRLNANASNALAADACSLGFQIGANSSNLDVVGFGLSGAPTRKVKVWDDLEVNSNLTANGDARAKGGLLAEGAAGLRLQAAANNLVFNACTILPNATGKSLDVHGYGELTTPAVANARKLALYDDVFVGNNLSVTGNLTVTGNITGSNFTSNSVRERNYQVSLGIDGQVLVDPANPPRLTGTTFYRLSHFPNLYGASGSMPLGVLNSWLGSGTTRAEICLAGRKNSSAINATTTFSFYFTLDFVSWGLMYAEAGGTSFNVNSPNTSDGAIGYYRFGPFIMPQAVPASNLFVGVRVMDADTRSTGFILVGAILNMIFTT